MKPYALLLCMLLLLSACQQPPAPQQGGEVEARVIEQPEAKPAEPMVTEVSFKTEDNSEIHGTLYDVPQAKEAVILFHMLGKDRHSWDDFAQALQAEGLKVLALDLRGHGASTKRGNYEIFYDTMSLGEYQKMVFDAKAAKNFLKEHGLKFHLVGASIGANIALTYAAQDSEIQSIVLLSPGEEYRGVRTFEANEKYKGRILFVVSEDDAYSYPSTTALSQRAGGPHLLKTYPDAGHGSDMLKSRPELTKLIIDWLKEAY